MGDGGTTTHQLASASPILLITGTPALPPSTPLSPPSFRYRDTGSHLQEALSSTASVFSQGPVTCLCTTEAFQSAILLILFPSCLPAAGPSLVTLLPWLLNLLNPALRGSSPEPSHCLLILWPRSCEHPVRASLWLGCGSWGLSVPSEAPPEEEPRTSLRPREDGHRGSLLLAARWGESGLGRGPMPLHVQCLHLT